MLIIGICVSIFLANIVVGVNRFVLEDRFGFLALVPLIIFTVGIIVTLLTIRKFGHAFDGSTAKIYEQFKAKIGRSIAVAIVIIIIMGISEDMLGSFMDEPRDLGEYMTYTLVNVIRISVILIASTHLYFRYLIRISN